MENADAIVSLPRERQYFLLGLGLFSGSFLFDAVSSSFTATSDMVQLSGWFFLIFGIVSTAGLSLMTMADVDANMLIQQRPHAVVAAVLVLVLSFGLTACTQTPQPHSQIFWLPVLPFVYFACRYTAIMQMQPGFPKFTEVFLVVLALDIASQGIWGLLVPLGSPYWVNSLFSGVELCAAASLAFFIFYFAPPYGSHTVQFHMTVYAYLFIFGVAQLVFQIMVVSVYDLAENEYDFLTIPAWLFGPLHILQAGILFWHRNRIHRWLGKRWLKRRLQSRGTQFSQEEQSKGALNEVEMAITRKDALNMHFDVLGDRAGGEKYTLLHYACFNGFVDSVSVLLSQPSVAVNTLSAPSARTSLFLAAEAGHLDCIDLLIAAGADVNRADVHGFSPLYAACFHGHEQCVRFLLNHGAFGADFTQEILLVAEGKGHHGVVQILIEEGAANNTARWMSTEASAVTRAHNQEKEEMHELQAIERKRTKKQDDGPSSQQGRGGDEEGTAGDEGTEVLSASLLYE
jgi:hypothetical protein